MLVASLLEAYVVVAADAGQHRDLLAAQAGNASAAAGVGDPDVLRPDELTPGAQVLADQVLVRHWHNDTPDGRVDPGPASTRKTGSLVQVLRRGDTRCMTQRTVPTLASPQPAEASQPSLIIGVLALGCGAFALLQTLVAPALPVLQRDLHTSTSGVAWVFTSFLLAAAVATPIAGRLGDMFGKKRVLVISLSTLAAGSLVA